MFSLLYLIFLFHHPLLVSLPSVLIFPFYSFRTIIVWVEVCLGGGRGGGVSVQMLIHFPSEINVSLFRYFSGLSGKCENKYL